MPAAATGAAISGGTLELRQQSANGAAATRTFTVNADGPATDDFTITSTIVDGGVASQSNLTIAGHANHRTVLGGSGANTFTGITSVNAGTVVMQKNTALGAFLTDEDADLYHQQRAGQRLRPVHHHHRRRPHREYQLQRIGRGSAGRPRRSVRHRAIPA